MNRREFLQLGVLATLSTAILPITKKVTRENSVSADTFRSTEQQTTFSDWQTLHENGMRLARRFGRYPSLFIDYVINTLNEIQTGQLSASDERTVELLDGWQHVTPSEDEFVSHISQLIKDTGITSDLDPQIENDLVIQTATYLQFGASSLLQMTKEEQSQLLGKFNIKMYIDS